MKKERMPWKTEVALKLFTVLNILFTFRIFEQLALALKNRVALNSLYWICIFYRSGFLSNLRLAWKHSLPCNISKPGGRKPRLPPRTPMLLTMQLSQNCTCETKHHFPYTIMPTPHERKQHHESEYNSHESAMVPSTNSILTQRQVSYW